MRRAPTSPRARQKTPRYPRNATSSVSYTVDSVPQTPCQSDNRIVQSADQREVLIETVHEEDIAIGDEAYLIDFDDDLETLMLPEHRSELSTTPTPASYREQTPTPAHRGLQVHTPQPRYFGPQLPGRPMNRWEYKLWHVEQLAKHDDPQDDPARFDPRQYLRDISQFTFEGLLGEEGLKSPSSTVMDSELSGYSPRQRTVTSSGEGVGPQPAEGHAGGENPGPVSRTM